MNELFKIEIIYPITDSLIDQEELSEVQKIRLEAEDFEDGHAVDFGYWDLQLDPVAQLNPRCFLPKTGKKRKYYTEAVFQSGNVAYAVGKPEALKEKIDKFLQTKE